MHFSTKIAALSGLTSTAAAHGIVNGFVTDGKWNLNFQIGHLDMDDPPETAGWTAQNRDHGFVSTADYQTPDIICHRDAKPSNTSASVSAGGTVEFQWTEWPVSHPGPVMTYVANCHGDCGNVNKEELEWVKIEEQGYVEEEKEWAAVLLAKDNSTWTTNVPETLAAGNYVFRHEIIGMYGKQHYPQCINIEITGDGIENPEGVIGTELYHDGEPEGNPGDPGAEPEKYTVPGPPVWTPGTTPTPSGAARIPPSGTAVSTGTDVPCEEIPAPETAFIKKARFHSKDVRM